jgi:hypothetical protein
MDGFYHGFKSQVSTFSLTASDIPALALPQVSGKLQLYFLSSPRSGYTEVYIYNFDGELRRSFISAVLMNDIQTVRISGTNSIYVDLGVVGDVRWEFNCV